MGTINISTAAAGEERGRCESRGAWCTGGDEETSTAEEAAAADTTAEAASTGATSFDFPRAVATPPLPAEREGNKVWAERDDWISVGRIGWMVAVRRTRAWIIGG